MIYNTLNPHRDKPVYGWECPDCEQTYQSALWREGDAWADFYDHQQRWCSAI